MSRHGSRARPSLLAFVGQSCFGKRPIYNVGRSTRTSPCSAFPTATQFRPGVRFGPGAIRKGGAVLVGT